MRDATTDRLQDPTTFAVAPGTSVALPGAGDFSDVLVAGWPVDTLIDVGRRLKIAARSLLQMEELARRASIAPAAAEPPHAGEPSAVDPAADACAGTGAGPAASPATATGGILRPTARQTVASAGRRRARSAPAEPPAQTPGTEPDAVPSAGQRTPGDSLAGDADDTPTGAATPVNYELFTSEPTPARGGRSGA
jgi:hypothetical protein